MRWYCGDLLWDCKWANFVNCWQSQLSDDNVSKYQCIFTKLGVYIDIVKICFGFVNGQISSVFDSVICPQLIRILVSGQYLSKSHLILNKFGICSDIVEIWFGIAHWRMSSILTVLSARDMMIAGYYRFTFIFYKENNFYHFLFAFPPTDPFPKRGLL